MNGRIATTALKPAVSAELLRGYTSHRPAGPIDLILDANEGLCPPPELLGVTGDLSTEVIRRYPSAAALETQVAERLDVSREQILVTAGGDDALYRCCALMLSEGRDANLTTPTFEMVRRYAMIHRAGISETAWMQGPLPVDAMIESITARTGVIAVVSPNNPTGAACTADDLRRLSDAAPESLLVVDLAYTEFADVDLTEATLELPNAVVIRTFSKALGLAGLRVGYAVGPVEVIQWLRAVGHPYAVSSLSIEIAARAMDLIDPQPFIERVKVERTALTALLAELGATPLPSQANFVLAKFDDAGPVRSSLASRGIAVRGFPDHPILNSFLRITCPGNPADFSRLTEAMRAAVRQGASP